MPAFPPLAGDTRTDVCVIGAGIAGLTTAYMLLREGKSVVVIDSVGIGDSGNGMTHCTAGAILVTDQILGRANRWSELYSPARQPFHGGVKAPAVPAAQWHGWRLRPSA